jgi:hypothetical protein
LAGADDEQAASKIGAAMLRDFLHVVGALDLLTDELLNLIDNEQGAREPVAIAIDLFQQIKCLDDGR